MRNLQEGRQSLAAVIVHGKKGDLYEQYYKGTEDQLGALGLVVLDWLLRSTSPPRPLPLQTSWSRGNRCFALETMGVTVHLI